MQVNSAIFVVSQTNGAKFVRIYIFASTTRLRNFNELMYRSRALNSWFVPLSHRFLLLIGSKNFFTNSNNDDVNTMKLAEAIAKLTEITES